MGGKGYSRPAAREEMQAISRKAKERKPERPPAPPLKPIEPEERGTCDTWGDDEE